MIGASRQILSASKKLLKLKLNELKGLDKNAKPIVINLNANDICNSKCDMCNIWKNKQQFEISPKDLKEILAQDFYSEVQGVGITGGEPTLRDDLVDLYKVCIEELPNLTSLSIITNCIQHDVVKQQLTEINTLCKDHGLHFYIMVSLDGYGNVHDKIRGRKDNFLSTIKVIDYVRNDLKLPVSFGATISKNNIWEIDELLDYAKENNLYGRFRVAEFIKRLYNDDREKVIRNFSDDETYQLLLFFEKLKCTFEKNSTYNRTYTSIQNVLLGKKRTIGCPYHNKGINVNSKGELAYCAPKSKLIGSALEESSQDIYRNNFQEKKRILKEDCDDCIHDYHAPITYREQVQAYKAQITSKLLNINRLNKYTRYILPYVKKAHLDKSKYSILIVGWYGTETVGDKAILAGILNDYYLKYGEKLNVIIGSLFPYITERTIVELNIKANVISTQSFEFVKYAKVCDETIMGGGPLMDLNELYVPLISFHVAKGYGKKTTIYGCGLGPIIQPKYKEAIRKILNLSSTIKLRDNASVVYAKKHFKGLHTFIEMSGDPAKAYLKKIKNSLKIKKNNVLALYLRDWEFAYGKLEMNEKEFIEKKSAFEKALSKYIVYLAEKLDVEKIVFNHMHNFVIGGDDRDFSRRFINTYFKEDSRIEYSPKLSTVETIAQSMINSKFNLCMRFHSVLFAHTLNTEFMAIDYTLGGKINGFLDQNNQLDKLITIDQLIDKTYETTIS